MPYLDSFCEVFPKLKTIRLFDQLLKFAYLYRKATIEKWHFINPRTRTSLIEALLDRLIQDEKSSCKSICNASPFYFRKKKYNWVHDELKTLLNKII